MHNALCVIRRLNNYIFALTLCYAGVAKDLQDKYGNTTVHYCSRYGNLDLCRWLIEMGCSPVSRNASGQTPYDVAENHLIRQYLLPLQFQAERDSNGAEYIGAGGSSAGPAPPVESSPLYAAANSMMAPRAAYPSYAGGGGGGGVWLLRGPAGEPAHAAVSQRPRRLLLPV
jgi:hypothetical protein